MSGAPRSVVMTTRYPLDHPGGVESVARALADCLSGNEQGWQVSHCAAFPGRAGLAKVPLLGDLLAAGRLAARVTGKGDVLLVHGAEYAWGPLAVARLTGRPVIAVWHGVRSKEVLPPATHRLGKAARKFFLWSQGLLQGVALQADATVAVSPAVAKQVRSRYNFQGEIKLIPNGVSMKADRAREVARTPAPAERGALRVLWVGTSAYQKGLDLALGACETARAQGQDISLTVAGLPAGPAGLERAAGGSWLTVLGAVPHHEMAAVYSRHDVLLFPSRYEAFGLVALEAMAAGLPVVGSSVVQPLIDGAGEVIAGEDVAAYARALSRLADPERRGRLASVGRARAQAFSWEASVVSYLEVLDAVDRG